MFLQAQTLDAALAEIRQTLDPRAAHAAIRAAVNDTARRSRGIIARAAGRELTAKISQVRKAIGKPLLSAASGEAVASIAVRYAALPLALFDALIDADEGVVAQLLRSGGAQMFKHMFQATMPKGSAAQKRGHKGIFSRVLNQPKYPPQRGAYAGRTIQRGPRKGQPLKRQAIKEQFGPALVSVLERDGTLSQEITQEIDRVLAERLANKLQWQLEKRGG